MEYYIIIAASIIIILSYLFNWISKSTRIPAVLLLILLGVGLHQGMDLFNLRPDRVMELLKQIRLLEVLGTLGLIMIVLEAALELKIERRKIPLITKSVLLALFGLLANVFIIGTLIKAAITDFSYLTAFIYATPLSVLSSAIVIPSVSHLPEAQKEFHIYESTFSDILGIILFYFLIGLSENSSQSAAIGDFSLSLVFTVVLSLSISYLLIYVFQKLEAKVKLFLMIAVLLLLFSVGKLFHLSSLIIILVFGLILSNHRLFFSGPLDRFIDRKVTDQIYESFLLITMETAFVIRTFFFVIFGFTVALSSLLGFDVAVVSLLILLVIYLLRLISLKFAIHENIKLATLIAPRGLITLLLYYSIPTSLRSPLFNDGILLFIIIGTSLIMTFGLIKWGNEPEDAELIAEATDGD